MESPATHCDMNTKTGRSLVFLGRIGTGKTHLACSIAAELAFQKRRVLNVTVAELICNLRAVRARPVRESALFRLLAQPRERLSEASFFDKLASLDLLVLEVGLQYGSESERVQLGVLGDMRYQRERPSVVISDCDVA
jgi:DNA replication protein DnaC